MIRIDFYPLDTLFFRDGRPFDLADEGLSRGVSVFPPPPTVLYGAARVIGKSKLDVDDISIVGSMLIKDDEFYVPSPYHLRRSESEFCNYSLTPKKSKKNFPSVYGNKRFQTIYAENGRRGPPPEDSEPLPAFVKLSRLLSVGRAEKGTFRLSGDGHSNQDAYFLNDEEIFSREIAAGISRDPQTNLPIEGKFYTSEKIRLEPGIGFRVDVDSEKKAPPDSLPCNGLVRLGGEARSARFELSMPGANGRALADLTAQHLNGQKVSGNFMLVAMSPVVIDHKCKFGFPEIDTNGHGTITCKSVLSRGLETIGFWNTTKIGPKPRILRCYPAGAVFFMNAQNMEMNSNELQKKLTEQGLGQGEHTKIGFGKTLFFPGWK